eukprot:jgi/Picsp_1/4423/NSC_06645-R1_possible glycosyltransferase
MIREIDGYSWRHKVKTYVPSCSFLTNQPLSLFLFFALVPYFLYWRLEIDLNPHPSTLNSDKKFEQWLRKRKNLNDDVTKNVGREYASNLLKSSEQARVRFQGKYLVLHTQFGLSNRLRALTSGLTFATKYGYWLRVLWERDSHLQVCIEDVLDLEESKLNDTWCIFDEAELELLPYLIIDHMDPDRPEERFKEIPRDQNLYIKTGFRFMKAREQTQFSDIEEQKSIDYIVPNVQVKHIVNKVVFPKGCHTVGMHIRQKNPMTELGTSVTKSYSSSSITMLNKAFLRQNKVSNFQSKINEIAKEQRTCFFIAIDDRNLLPTIEVPPPSILKFIPRECDDRGPVCTRFAFADLLSLGLCEKIYGSTWSSFTEMAGRMAKKKVIVSREWYVV